MKYFLPVLFFWMAAAHGEATKLALIGDGQACALLTAELSADAHIHLLERTEIKKVLQEHKLQESGLAAGKLAKLFPHADVFAVIRDQRLVVFNARNGFRLTDADVSGTSAQADSIRLAVQKLAVEEPVYVSIVSVRDVGVPRRYKPKIKEFTRAFEQELMKQPNLQMLERSHLALVNEERDLTAEHDRLTLSARLLTLEFEPGGVAVEFSPAGVIHNQFSGSKSFAFLIKLSHLRLMAGLMHFVADTENHQRRAVAVA